MSVDPLKQHYEEQCKALGKWTDKYSKEEISEDEYVFYTLDELREGYLSLLEILIENSERTGEKNVFNECQAFDGGETSEDS